MFPFSFTGLRLIHDEKVHNAMKQARIDVELARGSQRIVQMSLLLNVLIHIGSKLNIFSKIELLRHSCTLPERNIRDSS
jgi:hypothetical protein